MGFTNKVPTLSDIDTDEPVSIENESDYSPLKDVYFAFIDVLGFKKAFNDMKISNSPSAEKKYRDVFNYYFSLMNAANFMQGNNTGCYAGQTSDSLYFYTDRPDFLLQFIKIYSHFNLYSMSKDVFFRGGIAKGSLCTKAAHQFYGDSVIGAYLIESNISKNPIIVIDEKTHTDLSKLEEYSDLISDSGDRHYIKPFYLIEKSIVLDIQDDCVLNEIVVDDIKANISHNMSEFEYDESNYRKYYFLNNEFMNSTMNKSDSDRIE